MIDPVTALRTFYQGQANLTALTIADDDHGIYRTPPGWPSIIGDRNTAPKAIVIQQVGGSNEASYPGLIARMYLRFYAPTGPAAMEIYRRAYDLHYPAGVARGPIMINNRWLMRWAQLGQPAANVEPVSNWPVIVATIDVAFDSLQGAT